MKSAELTAIGAAEKVVRCIDVPDPGAPGAGEVLVDIVACSINPADILMIEGNYATKPETPCPLGIEGAGTVRAVGRDVTDLKVGDKVMSLARTNWAQQIRAKAESFIRLPTEVDLAQAAMLKVNVSHCVSHAHNLCAAFEGRLGDSGCGEFRRRCRSHSTGAC